MEAGRLNAYQAAPDAMRAVQRVEGRARKTDRSGNLYPEEVDLSLNVTGSIWRARRTTVVSLT